MIPSFAVSLLFGWEVLFKFIRSVNSSPFFIDHSTILPSELIETNPSPLSLLFPPFPTQWTSQIASECLPYISLFSATGFPSFFLKSYIATTPSYVPVANKFGFYYENLQQVIPFKKLFYINYIYLIIFIK